MTLSLYFLSVHTSYHLRPKEAGRVPVSYSASGTSIQLHIHIWNTCHVTSLPEDDVTKSQGRRAPGQALGVRRTHYRAKGAGQADYACAKVIVFKLQRAKVASFLDRLSSCNLLLGSLLPVSATSFGYRATAAFSVAAALH